jgi:hypothetical protein
MDDKIVTELEQKIITFVKEAKANYEDAYCWITEFVAFNMREVIRECRKNYYGIFEKQKDAAGRKKIWIPLTESVCDAVVKNIDKDQRELLVFSKDGEAVTLAMVVREAVRDIMDEMLLDEKLNDLTFNLSVNGTEVWKIGGEDKKSVDLLNIYIDPTADNLQNSDFLEREVLTLSDAKKEKDWMKKENLKGAKSLNRWDGEGFNANNNSQTELVEAFHFWGKIPKSFMTGKEKDDKEEVNGHIVVTGLNDNTGAKLQVVETYGKFKPYEECWYTKVPGRWYGRGVAEKLIMLQMYLNTLVNIRINRHNVSQLGIFKVKNGSNMSSEMLKRLISNGVIKVNQMDDIEQMPINDVGPASYSDENNIYTWSQRVTSAFEAATGESQPATMTATVGAIQQKSAGSQFTLVKERISQFLNRIYQRHWQGEIQKKLNSKDSFSVVLKPEELGKLDEEYAERLLSEMKTTWDAQEYEAEKQKILSQLSKKGNIRYFKNDGLELDDFDIEFSFDDGNFDKGAMVTDLMNMMKIAPEYRETVIPKVFDILGINLQLPKALPMPSQGQLQPQMSEMKQMSEAMTL